MAHSEYRRDIDGLRGIAVLSVILFHIDDRVLPGGFVGVDVFFVISGYLISFNVLRELSQGRFSIADFYRRRVKRIAPALLVVVAATLGLSQVLMRPEDAERVAESSIWSLLCLPNVYFWRHPSDGYFATPSAEKPLLHLWSLGVEEQFYLFWPPILLFAARARMSLQAASAAAAALYSVLLAELLFPFDPSFSYYMLPTRAGEMLVGALVAMAAIRDVRAPRAALLATAGLALIAASLFLLDETRRVPGLLVLPPTVGTALLLHAGRCGRSMRLLTHPALVGIGLISYSAYLWHWPVLAFLRYARPKPGAALGASVFVLTLALAWLTHRYVETPARRSKASALSVALRHYLAPAGVLLAVSAVAMRLDGYGPRWFDADYKAALVALREDAKAAHLYDYVCQRERLTPKDVEDPRCVLGEGPQAVLWGDSNAAHYVGMFGAFAELAGFSFRNVATGACPPLYDPTGYVVASRLADCKSSAAVVRPIVEASSVVILAASWTAYQRRSSRFLDDTFAAIRRLSEAGRMVIVVGKVPVIAGYDRLCREKALSHPLVPCRFDAVPMPTDVQRINASLEAFAAATPDVEYFDATAFLCPNGRCAVTDGGKPRYFDASHLTLAASWSIGRQIVRQGGVPEPFASLRSRIGPEGRQVPLDRRL